MKMILTAIAFAIAAPAAAQTAADPHAGHAPVKQPHGNHSGHGEHGQGHKAHQNCCEHKNADGKMMECCEKAQATGAKMECCEKHAQQKEAASAAGHKH